MSRNWRIHIIPASHMDYGWAASPGECFSYLSEVLRQAIDDMTSDCPELTWTVEYVLFMQRFVESYPEYLPKVKQLIKDGRLEVCGTMTGCIEQWLDGEMLIHQFVCAKRWLRDMFDYDARTAQHTDLPGHIIQIPQFLKGAEIDNLAYSRYHPPVPLHIWRAPDGTEVVACCHYQENYTPGDSWEGYGLGWVLFVHNDDPDFVEKELVPVLERRDIIWPQGVNALLMGCESDLQPSEPAMLERIRKWNTKHPEAEIHPSTPTAFFSEVDASCLPVFSGEAPYGFHALPTIYLPVAEAMRQAECAITEAEKWSVFAEWSDLGRVQHERIDRARDALFLPHDHNTAGRRGEINDAERYKDARHCLLEGDSIMQDKAMSFTVHTHYKNLREGVYPIVVFNGLSWERDDVVETYIELPLDGVKNLNMTDAQGNPIPSQILSIDEQQGCCRIYLVFVASGVPPHGYTVFYVHPDTSPVDLKTSLQVSPQCISNRYFNVSVADGNIKSIEWQGRELVRPDRRAFYEIYGLEDPQCNVEGAPWSMDENYTGVEWDCEPEPRVEVLESGPVRARVRLHGRILDTRYRQDITLYDALERIDFTHSLDYTPRMHSMLRVAYPLAVEGGKATYESPYGVVQLDTDEMPGTFRGHGERWVQKWIDISNPDFGVTLATRKANHVVCNEGIEPLLARTAIDCGTLFYYYDQDKTFTHEHALYPHAGTWKDAASHRAGWEYNYPLKSCNWTTCFPVKPLRRSKQLPETDSFLRMDAENVVLTAIAPSRDDPGAFLLRLVEYHGIGGQVELVLKHTVKEASEVNFLERLIQKVSHTGNKLMVEIKPFGIHTVKIKTAVHS